MGYLLRQTAKSATPILININYTAKENVNSLVTPCVVYLSSIELKKIVNYVA